MRRPSLMPVALLIALAVGCDGDPVNNLPRGVFLTVSEPITVGGSANLQLVNRTESSIQVGWLPCYIDTDRRVGNSWVEIPKEPGFCILPSFTIEPGRSAPFPFTAPATTGTFRIRTMVGGDSVFSVAFQVTQ